MKKLHATIIGWGRNYMPDTSTYFDRKEALKRLEKEFIMFDDGLAQKVLVTNYQETEAWEDCKPFKVFSFNGTDWTRDFEFEKSMGDAREAQVLAHRKKTDQAFEVFQKEFVEILERKQFPADDIPVQLVGGGPLQIEPLETLKEWKEYIPDYGGAGIVVVNGPIRWTFNGVSIGTKPAPITESDLQELNKALGINKK